jgi:hypothetical protein
MFQDTITTITSKSGVHVQKEVSHLFPQHARKLMDIFIIKNSFQTLVDIIIVDLTHLDLVQHVLTTIVHATIVVVQDKT